MICWQMGKTSRKAKTPLSEFKVTTPKNPLINNQAITSDDAVKSPMSRTVHARRN